MKSIDVATVVIVIVAYLGLNIIGTVYYMKVNKLTNVSVNEASWDLSSVILGWLIFPIFNMSSPVSYAVHAT